VEGVLFDQRTTMIAPACSAAAVVQQGFPIVFRLAWNDDDQAAVAAQFAMGELGVSRVAVIRDTTDFGRSLTNRFVKGFQTGGRRVVQIEIPADGAVDMDTALRQARQANPGAVAMFVDRPDAPDLFRELSGSSLGLPLITADTVLTGSCAVVPVGQTLENAVSSCLSGPASARRFVAAGLAEANGIWGTELDDLTQGAALAKDAFAIYAAAIGRVAVPRADGSLVIPKQALRNAIARTQMTGESGRIAFDSSGERRHDVGAALYQLDPDGTKLVKELRR